MSNLYIKQHHIATILPNRCHIYRLILFFKLSSKFTILTNCTTSNSTMISYQLRNIIRDIRPSAPELTEKNYEDQTGKTFLITGTSAGIGKEAAKLLLSKNAIVVAVNRNKEKTAAASEEIINGAIQLNKSLNKDVLSQRLINISADLSDLTTIKPAAQEVLKVAPQLDVVIFNAGVMEPPFGSVTKQGYELQFGCNVMAHQLLIDLIVPSVTNAAASGKSPRVIFTSSLSHSMSPPNGGMTWDFRNSPVKGQELYGQSKAGNIYQAAMFGEKYKNVVALSVHPGFLASDLQRSLPRPLAWLYHHTIMHPPVFGAYSELWAALNPKITTADSGKYVAPWGKFLDMRPDIQEGRYDGTAKKMVEWVESEIEQYK